MSEQAKSTTDQNRELQWRMLMSALRTSAREEYAITLDIFDSGHLKSDGLTALGEMNEEEKWERAKWCIEVASDAGLDDAEEPHTLVYKTIHYRKGRMKDAVTLGRALGRVIAMRLSEGQIVQAVSTGRENCSWRELSLRSILLAEDFLASDENWPLGI